MKATLRVTNIESRPHEGGVRIAVLDLRCPITGETSRMGVTAAPGEKLPAIGDQVHYTVGLTLNCQPQEGGSA